MGRFNPFDIAIKAKPDLNPGNYIIGMTVVGCLKHDHVVSTLWAPGWKCPECAFEPREDAPPFTVVAIDYGAGSITVA